MRRLGPACAQRTGFTRSLCVLRDEAAQLRARSVTEVKIPRASRSRFTLANQSSTGLEPSAPLRSRARGSVVAARGAADSTAD
jgi:hypothetical protein